MPRNVRWAQIRPTLTRILEDAREKANKQLAHLTAWRKKIERDAKRKKKRVWYHNKIWRDLEIVIKEFEKATGIKF